MESAIAQHTRAHERRSRRRARYQTALVLTSIAFVVYNLNLRSTTSFDTYPTRLLPISIIRHFTLDLDMFDSIGSVPQWSAERKSPVLSRDDAAPRKNYWVVRIRGHYMS